MPQTGLMNLTARGYIAIGIAALIVLVALGAALPAVPLFPIF